MKLLWFIWNLPVNILWFFDLYPTCGVLHSHLPVSCGLPRGHIGDHFGIALDAGVVREECSWSDDD